MIRNQSGAAGPGLIDPYFGGVHLCTSALFVALQGLPAPG
jgi:hypothetical protein